MHRGEVLSQIINKVGFSKTKLAEKINCDRATIYRHIGNPKLKFSTLQKYSEILNLDFSSYFPEMKLNPNKTPNNLQEAIAQIDYWRGKYIELLEKK